MNKAPENKPPSDAFLNTEGGKTKSNAIETPTISLPKGGGAIRGIDEKFNVNAVNGTASFSVPLPVSAARGVSPGLSLSYSSGGGNGIFGLGWALGLASIKRKTDKELPRYFDAFDSDTFLFSEAEDLVPEFKKEADGSLSLDLDGKYIIKEKDSPDGLFTIRSHRPRIEGLFALIERWSHKTLSEIRWRVITRENVTTLFGWSPASRIVDPQDAGRIYEWLPEFVFDDQGNCSQYVYKKEDAAGIDTTLVHNRNRLMAGVTTYTNLYLKEVLYGNKTPYKKFGDAVPPPADFMFRMVFDFGEHAADAPCEVVRDWDFREDAFSAYKAGFEIRTTRVCRRVLLYHFFDELPGGSALVRSFDIDYDTAAAEGFTFLRSMATSGYIKQTGGAYTKKTAPATEFEYQKHDWNNEIKTVGPDDLVNSPTGLSDPPYMFTDLYNEGLSGILSEQANGGWYYKHNLGNGRFERAKLVTPKPSFAGLGGALQLADLDGNGGKQLVSYDSEPRGFFELDDDDRWQRFTPFDTLPNIDLREPNTRMVDLNGDGTPDVLITEDTVFTWHPSMGKKGFGPSQKTLKLTDEEAGPHMVFAEPTQTIFLADMQGDGLTDIVRVRNGEICYWPNLGYGRFGAKVAMDNAPVFDHPEAFDPGRVRLADIDGSGTTDLIYLGRDRFTCWVNLSGNAFSDNVFELDMFPAVNHQANINVTDLLGNGVQCIVWSSDLAKFAGAPLKYVDLMNGKKPHVMTRYKNNLGKEVLFEYAASTKFYIEDKLAGRPWATKLHFPVQCVARTETRDTISGLRFVTSYRYHHGYFDHAEKEFRGFGLVEQTNSEHFEHWVKGTASNIVDKTLHQPPDLTRSWFHTGAFLARDKILDQLAHEYWYEEMALRGFAVTNNETPLPDARLTIAPGLDPALLDHLSGQEWSEALRACKTMGLRSEVFALDAPLVGATPDEIKRELTPFTVATHNCVIELVQPKGQNKHAVFVVKESEGITYSYERVTDDPRVAHNLNIKLDEYGNVLESATIVYPRAVADVSLPAETRAVQNRTLVSFVENRFTNDIVAADDYRLRLPSEVKTYELKGVAKAGSLYSLADFNNILAAALEVDYHEVDSVPAAGTSQKRLIEHTRTLYYNDNLKVPLVLHHLGQNGLVFEAYQLAYTPDLITDIFGVKVNAALMTEGRFVHSEGDDNWWVRSGTLQYLDGAETVSDAENRFFKPVSYTDQFGGKTRVKYFSSYFLLIEETEDALQNKTTALSFNMRTLSPRRMRDANDNISEVITDELGMVKAMAVFGKGAEADDLTGIDEFSSGAEAVAIAGFFNAPASDQVTALGKSLLNHASARFVYDLDVYKTSGGTRPVVAASINREEHFAKNPASPVQIAFEYSNGLGQIVMKKVQAEPGLAKLVTVNPDDTYTVSDVDTSAPVPKQLRWIGDGRTVLNNKAKPVKQYEPYFSVTPAYEDLKELVETGVTPVFYYDALGRMNRKEFADGTFSKTQFDSWHVALYDQNDTVLETDWYTNRFNRLIDAELIAAGKDPGREKVAAERAAKHAGTPVRQHRDTLGRLILQVEHNKDLADADIFQTTVADIDLEGNLRTGIDARGNPVMRYKYDMLGNMVYQDSMDMGKRWMLQNVVGNTLRSWDERDHQLWFEYDTLHRPTVKRVKGGDGPVPLDNVYEKTVYGEGLAGDKAKNLRGRPAIVYDTAGKVETIAIDFKGNPLSTSRTFAKDHKQVTDWAGPAPDLKLEAESFLSTFEYDAMNRVVRQTAADATVYRPAYNEAGLVDRVEVAQGGPFEVFVKNIDYNEKGARTQITYGNDVSTNYFYDKQTFRLIRLETKRAIGDPLQDLYYTFDPVGNVTHIEDKNIPDVFFNNQKITGTASYTYDAVYRLIEATGREHIGVIGFDALDNWNDLPFMKQYSAGDAMAWRTYTQKYRYDKVGNIGQMQHIAAGGDWTRNYDYAAGNNRLVSTRIGALTYNYSYHPQHGFITKLPHLEVMSWNFKDDLQATAKQKVILGTPETTWYVYDGTGQRVRKITEREAADGVVPSRKSQRVYLGNLEIYREYDGAGAIALERRSYHVMDDKSRIAMIETRTIGVDAAPARLVRYQFGNHLGSASIETDATSRVISYEEYHPFGTTSYQAMDKDIKATAKRYRHCGMERDEESGLAYHGARYYLPWIGRWLSGDPIGIGDGVNLYAYCKNNPVMLSDTSGTDARVSVDQTTKTITFSTTVHVYGTADEIKQFKPAAERTAKFFSDSSGAATVDGKAWNVRYDVSFEFHDTATAAFPTAFTGIMDQLQNPEITQQLKDYPGIVSLYGEAHRASFASGTSQVPGYKKGDAVVTFADLNTGGPNPNRVGVPSGTTYNLISSFRPEQIGSTPEPVARALVAIDRGQNTTEDELYRTLTHEIGHTLGFAERYDAKGGHERFEDDVMSNSDASIPFVMNPSHREDSARFAAFVANGRNLKDAAMGGFHVDFTGSKGSLPEYVGGAANPDYKDNRDLLPKAEWNAFKQKFAPPPLLPKVQFFPGPMDRQAPVQILPKYDQKSLPGVIELGRFHF